MIEKVTRCSSESKINADKAQIWPFPAFRFNGPFGRQGAKFQARSRQIVNRENLFFGALSDATKPDDGVTTL